MKSVWPLTQTRREETRQQITDSVPKVTSLAARSAGASGQGEAVHQTASVQDSDEPETKDLSIAKTPTLSKKTQVSNK